MNSESQIQASPRTSAAGMLIIGGLAALYSAAALLPVARPAASVLALVLVLIAVRLHEPQVAAQAVLFCLLLALPALHPLLARWPWSLLLPVLLQALLSLVFPNLRRWNAWLMPGRLDRGILLLIGMTVIVSASALVLWERVAQPDLSRHLASMPSLSPWLVPFAALGFSVGNAAIEEVVFRGAVMQGTDAAFGPGLFSLFVQAWLFGAAHFLHGFPNGWWGLALASVYGLMLGGLRRRSGGIAAPWLAHAGADLVIFLILIARSGS